MGGVGKGADAAAATGTRAGAEAATGIAAVAGAGAATGAGPGEILTCHYLFCSKIKKKFSSGKSDRLLAPGMAMAVLCPLVRINRQQSACHACHKQDRRDALVASRREGKGVRAQLTKLRSSA